MNSVEIPGGKLERTARRLIFDNGEENRLTKHEFDLLCRLCARPNHVITRTELLKSLWNRDAKPGETRTVDMTISRLREKIRDPNGAVIRTVRGQGYLFVKGK